MTRPEPCPDAAPSGPSHDLITRIADITIHTCAVLILAGALAVTGLQLSDRQEKTITGIAIILGVIFLAAAFTADHYRPGVILHDLPADQAQLPAAPRPKEIAAPPTCRELIASPADTDPLR